MKKVLFILSLLLLFCPLFVLAEQIDINSASLSLLNEIIHVGDKTAQKIIDGRPYGSVQDLSKVKGIGNGKYLQDIINQGLACVNCKTEITESAETVYPSGVFINEIMPNPQGADETEEWVELYNSNTSDVDLSGWQIQDTEGTPSIFTFKNTKIPANGFFVFKRPETKIMLNNDADGLNLLNPDKKIIDSISFTKAPLGQSYNKTNSGWSWSTTSTPGAVNTVKTLLALATPKALQADLSKIQKSDNNKVELAAADLSEAINQDTNTANPWFLFFSALAITIILAAAVLFIKLKIFNHVRT